MCCKNPTISIVIPIYNVEKYLRKALDSVLAQTFKDYEAIMINDGSTDKSYEIAKEYADKYENFYLVSKENEGLGATRNVGIKMAKGEYIAFLDSDDYLYPTYLEVLYNNAKRTGADISCCNFTYVFNKSGWKFYMPFAAKSGVFSGEAVLKMLIMDVQIHYFSWNKLFKRSLFTDNDVTFYNMFFEDIATIPKLFYYSKKVVITSKSLYYYRRRSGSILSTIDADKVNDFMRAINIMRDFLEKENAFDKYRKRFKLYLNRLKVQNMLSIWSMHASSLNFKGMLDNYKRAETTLKMMKRDDYFPENDSPELPCYVRQPVNKRQKNIATKK